MSGVPRQEWGVVDDETLARMPEGVRAEILSRRARGIPPMGLPAVAIEIEPGWMEEE